MSRIPDSNRKDDARSENNRPLNSELALMMGGQCSQLLLLQVLLVLTAATTHTLAFVPSPLALKYQKLRSFNSDSCNKNINPCALLAARVAFVAGSAPSEYGATSPLPNPSWFQVAEQLARRLPHFVQSNDDDDDEDDPSGSEENKDTDRIQTCAIDLTNDDCDDSWNNNNNNVIPDVVLVLGVVTPTEQARLDALLSTFKTSSDTANKQLKAVLCDPTCAPQVFQKHRFVGSFGETGTASWQSQVQAIANRVAPFATAASHQRLLQKADTLLARKSSEDYLFAILFVLHALVTPVDVVKSDINPSWEKGIVRNVQEFASMADCCGPQIQAALSDPQSKRAIDLLNELDLRDQVGSYRVIVSNETPQLEDFTLCILQQNNCFQCDSPILTQPKVPLMETWRGQPLDATAASQILLGHLDHPESALPESSATRQPFSWKIVVGANPAYDAFPMQHQIFYPSGSSRSSDRKGNSMWYDPVFCVETLDDELVWCKRHYRCTPRKHWSGKTAGAWTLTTLDNGMVSEEHWTTVDAANDLSWVVLHYSGAAKRAGQSYVGALLCSEDGQWPPQAKPGSAEWNRIQKAFRNCDLELWELFGGSYDKSYMWSSQYAEWAAQNPPPLDLIGDVSITTWRKRMRASGNVATK